MGTERALLPCDCGGCGQAHVSRDGDVEWIACPDCGYQGPLRLSLADAIAAWNQRLSAPPPAAAPVRPDGEREADVIRRIVMQANRERRSANWTTDAILAALPPRGEIEAEVIERCAKVAEAWGGKHSDGPTLSVRTYIAAAIRAQVQP